MSKTNNKKNQKIKKRIFIYANTPPPIIGSSNAIYNLLKSDIQNDFKIKHIRTNYSRNLNELGKYKLRKVFLFFAYLFRLIYEYIVYKPEIVIFSPAFNLISFIKDSIPIFLSELIFRKKCIIWVHGNGLKDLYDRGNLIFKKFIEYIFRHASYVVPVSSKIVSENYNYFNSNDKIFIINNGIDSKINNEKVKNGSTINIIFFSNMILSKGWKILFNAAEILCEKYDNLSFLFAGEPWKNNSLINNVFKNCKYKDRIKYLGPLHGEEKEKLFLNADIFCFPTQYKYETFGIVNIEAMKYSLPVVTSNKGGIPEIIIDEKGGFILNEVTVETLMPKLERLINDSNLRISMGKFNKQKFDKEYTLDVFIEKWRKLLSKA